jgi:hypothetical protein
MLEIKHVITHHQIKLQSCQMLCSSRPASTITKKEQRKVIAFQWEYGKQRKLSVIFDVARTAVSMV